MVYTGGRLVIIQVLLLVHVCELQQLLNGHLVDLLTRYLLTRLQWIHRLRLRLWQCALRSLRLLIALRKLGIEVDVCGMVVSGCRISLVPCFSI